MEVGDCDDTPPTTKATVDVVLNSVNAVERRSRAVRVIVVRTILSVRGASGFRYVWLIRAMEQDVAVVGRRDGGRGSTWNLEHRGSSRIF